MKPQQAEFDIHAMRKYLIELRRFMGLVRFERADVLRAKEKEAARRRRIKP